jgi:hypothetical protein
MQTYPDKYSLHDISSYDSTECYVLGRRLNSIVIIKSTDLGFSWKVIKDDYETEINTVPLLTFRICNPFKNYVYLGRENYNIMKSSDGCINFDTLKVLPEYSESDNYIRGLSMADTNSGIASTSNNLFITKDGWKTFKTFSKLNIDIPDDFHLGFGDAFSNNVYAFDDNNFISRFILIKSIAKNEYIRTTGTIKTTDGGKNWHFAKLSENKAQNEPANYINSFYFHDSNNGWGVGYRSNDFDSSGSSYKSIIYKTTDGGFSWSINFEISAGLPEALFQQIAFRDYKRGVVVGKFGSQFYTTDGGNTWVDESRKNVETKSLRTVQQVTFMGNIPIISTIYDGIYTAMKYHKTTDVIEDYPQNFDGLIYPNPASDYIEISLSNKGLQSFAENVKVQIFNTLGIEVSSAGGGVNEVDGGGYRIDISNLPTGVYFIKIGDKVEKFVKM